LSYLREAYNEDWPKPEEQTVRQADGSWKLYKPQGMGTKLKRFFTDYQKNPDKDIFEAWDNWADNHAMIEDRLERPWPGKCISYVPFDKVLRYACRDADATLRLWTVLNKMRRNVRRTVQENWGDYEKLARPSMGD
jgi:hypothetical protein